MNQQNRRAVTLTELLIALVITGMVILAVASVDIVSRRFFQATTREFRIQDEAKIALEHMARNFVRAHEIYDFGFRDANSERIGVRLDFACTPDNSADDTWVVYDYDSATGVIRYYRDASSAPGTPPPAPPAGGWVSWIATANEDIAENILDSYPIPMFTVTDNQIDINLTAQDPTDTDRSINLQTSVVLSSMSGI
jgi:hypothetical protein